MLGLRPIAGAPIGAKKLRYATVITNNATEITAVSAVLQGESQFNGDHYVYFEHRQAGETTWSETEKQSVSGATVFEQEIDLPLIAGEADFEFRAVVEQDGVASYGDTLTFTSEYLARGRVTASATFRQPGASATFRQPGASATFRQPTATAIFR